jgi:hypothetical protein
MAAEYKISFRSDGKLVSGTFLIDGQMITVRSDDGRAKRTQLSGSTPETLARLLLLEMEREKPGQ